MALCGLCLSGLIPAACAPSGLDSDRQPASFAEATRIVSLDFCADQYVLKLADRDRILALSPKATSDLSYMREAADGLPIVRPVGEDVLALKPDLVVRTYGGGSGAARLYGRAGVPVLQIGWAGNIDGIKRVTKEVGTQLGAENEAAEIVGTIERRLDALSRLGDGAEGMYLTPSGTTTGPGSLIDEMMREAGLTNFEPQPGWHPVPLERLVSDRPDLVVTAFFDTESQHDQWSLMRHPVARELQDKIPTVDLPSALTACGGWFAMDALDAIDDAVALLSLRPETSDSRAYP
jgi:iron complex transport system substrate-binding protein